MPRGLFNWNYFLLLFPIQIIVVFATIAPQPLVPQQIPRWTLVTVVSYAVMAIPFGLAHYFSKKFSNIYQEFAAMSVVGLIRGFAILDLSLILNLPSIKPYILRPLNSALVVPIWFLVTHLIFGSRRNFQEEFHQMYARAVHSQIESMGEKLKKGDPSLAEVLSKKIDTALDPLRKQFESIAGSKITPKELADESLIIRSFVEAQIRPLSHDLWRTRKFKPPRLAFSKVLVYSLLRTRLPLYLTLLPTIIFGVAGISAVYGFSFALRQTFFIWIFYSLIAFFYSLLFPRIRNTFLLNSIFLLIALIFPGNLDGLLVGHLGIEENPLNAELIGAGWYFALIIGFSVYRSIENYYESIRALMTAQIQALNSSANNSSSALLSREYASYLHGDVQSQLLSASMQMQKAAEEGNIELGKKAIRRAEKILRRDHQKYVVGSAISPKRRLQKLIDAWQGIAQIEVIHGESLELPDSSFALINEIVEELISNAIRHGGAGELSISIVEDGDQVLLTFIDDGKEIKGGKKGMGSQVIRSKSLSYDYERTGTRNRITIALPK